MKEAKTILISLLAGAIMFILFHYGWKIYVGFLRNTNGTIMAADLVKAKVEPWIAGAFTAIAAYIFQKTND